MGIKSENPPNEMRCKTCGYDLRNLPEHRCPECGGEFDPEKAWTYNNPSSRYIDGDWCMWGSVAGFSLGGLSAFLAIGIFLNVIGAAISAVALEMCIRGIWGRARTAHDRALRVGFGLGALAFVLNLSGMVLRIALA